MRPSKQQYFIDMAKLAAKRGTCPRRQVGCVFVDDNDRVMSTGYNGAPPGIDHCIDKPCAGACYKSGEGLDKCIATHAEINALSFCPDIRKVKTIYVTLSPCVSCTKALLNTSAQEIIFEEEYASSHNEAKEWWISTGRTWTKHDAV